MPLQRRPLVNRRARQSLSPVPSQASNDTAGGSRGPGHSHRGAASLRSINKETLRENLRVVATFLDEPAEKREGSQLQEEAGEAADAGSVERRHSLEAGQCWRTRGGKEGARAQHLHPKLSASSGRPPSSRSLPPLASPPASARGRRRGSAQTPRQRSSPTAGLEGSFRSPPADRARKIMVALNLDAYKGVPQVKRQVFSGDEQPRSKAGMRPFMDDMSHPGGDEAEALLSGTMSDLLELPGSPAGQRAVDEEAE